MSTAPTRGFWPLRDLPVAIWLALLVVTTFVHQWLPVPRWLMIHLLLLGAISHAILVWSQFFAAALLREGPRPAARRQQSARLVLLNLGAVVVLAGVTSDRWWLTVAGAVGVGTAVLWHGADLFVRLRRALPSRFVATVRYYVAAACFLPLGAGLGTALAHGLGHPGQEQVRLAHASLNLLGWMGLTIAGTLVTLWPTMLRTRVADGAERAGARALPVLVLAVLVTAAGAVSGFLLLAAAGLAAYLAGLAVLATPFVVAARQRPPSTFPTLAVLAGVLWWVGGLLALAVGLATAGDWVVASDRFAALSPYLAAGFGAQVLLGALSYLVPVALGRGPSAVRAANQALDRGAVVRVVVVNAGLLVCVLPAPSVVRVTTSLVVLLALATFLPLLVLAVRRSARAARVPVEERRRGPAADERPAGQRTGQAVTGLAVVVLAVAAGVAVDPLALGGTGTAPASAGVVPTGDTTTVQVEAVDMRFVPDRLEVPAGDRLVIELTNTDDSDVHDLVLDSGARSGRLSPGESAVVDVGVVGRDLDGWCSVVGHRQMGMVLDVVVLGGAAAEPAGDPAGHGDQDHGDQDHGADGPAAHVDHDAEPGPGFRPYDAVLPPLPDTDGRHVHRHTFTVTEQVQEVAPGVTQKLWTFNGTAPGPVLHGQVGDVFEITLVNDGSMGHSIDFHAGALAPDRPMRTIPPGESLVYRFRATRAGAWMYHCSTMPMSAHIANGMFGTVVIEPRGLPEVDRSYVLTQSELYLGPEGEPVDVEKVAAERPDLVVFNGYANQYDHAPLPARVGERVRVWVLVAGPNRGTSFHVVGGQLDTVWSEGAYLLRRDDPGAGGSQALALAPAQGGFVELEFPEAGHYPFVSHVMIDAERGAHGIFRVRD